MESLAPSQPDPVRVFVASTPAEWLPMRVLEFSIRASTSLPVEFAAIHAFNRTIPIPRAVENHPRTPFSFQRFLIPELCGFSGKAIYLDADMLVFQDICGLWNQDFAGADLQTVKEARQGRHPQFSVMLLDCKALGWRVEQIVAELNAGKLDYAALMFEMRVARKVGRAIPPEWNSLERFSPGKTCLLHFTDMNTQPWISTANPLGYLWIACLRRALQAGFVSRAELEREAACGHIRPSLPAQIDSGVAASVALGASFRRLDRQFVPPYRSLHSGRSPPWTSLRWAVLAGLRRSYYRSPLPRLFNHD